MLKGWKLVSMDIWLIKALLRCYTKYSYFILLQYLNYTIQGLIRGQITLSYLRYMFQLKYSLEMIMVC